MHRRFLFSRKVLWITAGIICFALGSISIAALSQTGGGSKSSRPPITWNPSSVDATVYAGLSSNLSLSFVSSQDLDDVSIRVVPELQPFVQITPQSISQITNGQLVTLNLSILTPSTMLPQTNPGTPQVHSGKSARTIASPLPVTINVHWQRLEPVSSLDFSVNYPPTYVPTVNSTGGSQEVGFSENQDAYNGGIAPVLVITSQKPPASQTLRDWIHSFGVGDSNMTEVPAGSVIYLKWTEAGGEGDENATSYSVMAPDGNVVTVTAHSTALADSSTLNNILSSLTFTTQ